MAQWPPPKYAPACKCAGAESFINIPNGVKIAIFSEKLQELPSVWGLCPPAPIVVTCSLAHNFHNKQLKIVIAGLLNKVCFNKM